VLLTGAVKTDSQRQRAEQIARTTAGVSSVSNRIELR
jgi:osmotically-inducible protein OsmY